MSLVATTVPSAASADDPQSRDYLNVVRLRGQETTSDSEQPPDVVTRRDQEVRLRKGYTIVDYKTLPTDPLTNSGLRSPDHSSVEANRISGRKSAVGRRGALPVAEKFWLLNRWRGQVLRVDSGDGKFEAQLFDSAQPSVVEIAEFAMSELPPDGLALLKPGAEFYWMIGYRDLGTRQRKRESVIWMRRAGRMGEDKFKASLDEVDKIWRELEGRAEPTATRE